MTQEPSPCHPITVPIHHLALHSGEREAPHLLDSRLPESLRSGAKRCAGCEDVVDEDEAACGFGGIPWGKAPGEVRDALLAPQFPLVARARSVQSRDVAYSQPVRKRRGDELCMIVSAVAKRREGRRHVRHGLVVPFGRNDAGHDQRHVNREPLFTLVFEYAHDLTGIAAEVDRARTAFER